MNNKTVNSFLKTSQIYLLLTKIEEANLENFTDREKILFENMRNRLLSNINLLKEYENNSLVVNDELLEEINSYSEAVLQKLNFHLK